MLPKPVYSKIVQALKKMRVAWEADRAEDPNRAPYEIDSQLKMTIEREMREGRMSMDNTTRDQKIQETFAYLEKQGLITKSPYGGHFFPLPKDTVIPTKEELIAQTKKTIGRQNRTTYDPFFGKPQDFNDY
jgi:hypothetical protein